MFRYILEWIDVPNEDMTEYEMQSHQTLKIKTTESGIMGSIQLFFKFTGPLETTQRLIIRLINPTNNRWSYIITGCTTSNAADQFLIDVPNEETRIWRIRLTSTNLRVTCDTVEVLNFEYTADSSFPECSPKWSRSLEYVSVFHEYGNSLQMRYPISGKNKT